MAINNLAATFVHKGMSTLQISCTLESRQDLNNNVFTPILLTLNFLHQEKLEMGFVFLDCCSNLIYHIL